MRRLLWAIVAAVFIATAPAAAQTTKVGSYEFNTGAIPTVTTSAVTAGQALASLQTINIANLGNVSGFLNQVSVESKGGSTTSVVVYVWDNPPAATTCTAGSNFVVSQTDNEHLISGTPLLIPLATVAAAQDTHTYGATTNLAAFFANASGTGNLSYCPVANGSVTPASASDYRINFSGSRDGP